MNVDEQAVECNPHAQIVYEQHPPVAATSSRRAGSVTPKIKAEVVGSAHLGRNVLQDSATVPRL